MPALLVVVTSCSTTMVDQSENEKLLENEARTYHLAINSMQLHTDGNRIFNVHGDIVTLHGVNIASLEWQNNGDHVEESVKRAIDDWKVNLIRLPLAQDRWFGKMTNQTDNGLAYRKIVDYLVSVCAQSHVYIDLDLHWSDCGKWVNEGGKLGQHNLPDENSILFWRDVATRYKNYPNVIFGLYNEPHDAEWTVWLNGGTVTDKPSRWERDQTQIMFPAVGIQQLCDAVRATGAKNIVTASGLDWGYDLSGVLKGFALKGTNIIYETHPLPEQRRLGQVFWRSQHEVPVYVGEWGFRGTNGLDYAKRLMAYIQQHHIQVWTAWDFHPHAGPTLIKNWSYEPTEFGQFVKGLLAPDAAPDSM